MLLKKRAQKHPFERVPTPYQVYTWLSPHPEHMIDYIRAEDGESNREMLHAIESQTADSELLLGKNCIISF